MVPAFSDYQASEMKMWAGYLKSSNVLYYPPVENGENTTRPFCQEIDQKFSLAWATHFLKAEQIFSSAREHHGRIQIRTCLLEWGSSNAHCFFWSGMQSTIHGLSSLSRLIFSYQKVHSCIHNLFLCLNQCVRRVTRVRDCSHCDWQIAPDRHHFFLTSIVLRLLPLKSVPNTARKVYPSWDFHSGFIDYQVQSI